jgi:ribosomal protein L22
MTQVLARAKHVPMSARKVRRVINQVRGLNADEALTRSKILRYRGMCCAYLASWPTMGRG